MTHKTLDPLPLAPGVPVIRPDGVPALVLRKHRTTRGWWVTWSAHDKPGVTACCFPEEALLVDVDQDGGFFHAACVTLKQAVSTGTGLNALETFQSRMRRVAMGEVTNHDRADLILDLRRAILLGEVTCG